MADRSQTNSAQGGGRRATAPARTCTRSGGFTLVEITVVVAIGALLVQLVISNLGAWIPARAMDSAAQQLVARLDYFRSEARLQGKPYTVELDLTHHRFRTILPPEDRHFSSEAEEEEGFSTSWAALEDDVEFAGYLVAGGAMMRSLLAPISFDAKGFTADQTIYLVHGADEQMVWSIQISGLTGTATIARSFEGDFQPIATVGEGHF